MKGIPSEFDRYITAHDMLIDRTDSHIQHIKARITFVDGSILMYTDIDILSEERRKYSFQWMKSDGTLLIRWDNAEHHQHISTHPHHKQVSSETNIEPSPEMTLHSVLAVISEQLL
jgi:hypothetical protein